MPLIVPPELQAELVRLAREGDPDEVCGILGGQGERVERVCPVRNAAEEIPADSGVFRDRHTGTATSGSKPVHYYMDPRDQLRVYNELDQLELDVVGYYHSHTHTEARPSPTDVRLANDLAAFYVLVSLEEPGQPSVRAWKVLKAEPGAETGELQEHPIVVESAQRR